MASAIASAADAVLLPEHGSSFDEIIDAVASCVRESFGPPRSKRRVLIIKAEGVEIPMHMMVDELEAELADLPDVDIRGTVLGHLVRGGNSSFRDRLLAGRFGLVAVEALLEGRSDVMVGWNLTQLGLPTSDAFIRLFPIDDVLTETAGLLDGSSDVTMDRVRRMEAIHGVLAL
jgi:6-phosphofructokinase 1